jgi:hypothetical protein
MDRLPALAANLVRRRVAVFVARGSHARHLTVTRSARQHLITFDKPVNLPASSPVIGADDECRGISAREERSAWIAQDLQPSLSDL